MANKEHLKILKSGIKKWNLWRERNPTEMPDLRNAELPLADLRGANLSRSRLQCAELGSAFLDNAILSHANLKMANLGNAKLTGAHLNGSILSGSLLFMANLEKSDLTGARLIDANLTAANLRYALLKGAILEGAILVGANVEDADLSFARVYGASAWNLKANKNTKQNNLIITPVDEPDITVYDLEIAQFVYLILHRQKIRKVIDTITSKIVLILGRFTKERKVVLDMLANELKLHDLVPIIFDFDRVKSRDFSETIRTLAGMSLFVIVDITNPRSAPLELQATVPDYQVPFVPIIEKGEKPFSMFIDLKTKYNWVLDPLEYASLAVLKKVFKRAIIDEAFEVHKKLIKQKAKDLQTRNADIYIKEIGKHL